MEKSKELSLNNITLEHVPQLLEKVNTKLNSLKNKRAIEDNKIFEINLNKGPLCKQNNVTSLISIISSIKAHSEYYKESQKELGKIDSKYSFKYKGYSYEQWFDAIDSRIKELENKKELERLKKSKALLEQHLSEEDKFKKSMIDVMSILTED